MRVYLHCLKAGLLGMLLPVVGTVLMCAGILSMLPPQSGIGTDRAAGYWLHLPGLLLVTTGLGAALDSWPLFSRAQAGAAWILRTQRTPLRGCLVAALGNLTALATALVCAGACFALLLSSLGFDLGAVRSRVRFEGAQRVLTDANPSMSLSSTSGTPVAELAVRPRPFLIGTQSPAGMSPAQLRLRADGELLHPNWIESIGDPIRIEISPPRTIDSLTLERKVGDTVAVSVGSHEVEALSSGSHSGTLNCILASLTYLVPALLALGVMILGHSHLILPVNFAAGTAALVLATLLEFTPNTTAVTAFARARWVWGEDLGTGTLFTAGTVAVLLILRAALDSRARY